MRKTKLLIGLVASAFIALGVGAGLKNNLVSAKAENEEYTFIDFNWLKSASSYGSTDEHDMDDGTVVSVQGSLSTNDTSYFESPSKPVTLGSETDESYITISQMPYDTIAKIELDMVTNQKNGQGVKIEIGGEEAGSYVAESSRTLLHVSCNVNGQYSGDITITNTGSERRCSVSNIKITYGNAIDTTEKYVVYFMNKTGDVCSSGENDNFDGLNEIWQDLENTYDLLPGEEKERLVSETADSKTKECVERYSYIIAKYNTETAKNLNEFIEGVTVTYNSHMPYRALVNNQVFFVILGVSALAAGAFVTVLLTKKKSKKNN